MSQTNFKSSNFSFLCKIIAITYTQVSFRMLILEMTLGIGGGLGSAVSGVWAKASGGFFQPMIGTSFIAFLALCLLPLLPNSQKIMKERQADKVREEKENADKDLLREVQRKSICVCSIIVVKLKVFQMEYKLNKNNLMI